MGFTLKVLNLNMNIEIYNNEIPSSHKYSELHIGESLGWATVEEKLLWFQKINYANRKLINWH